MAAVCEPPTETQAVGVPTEDRFPGLSSQTRAILRYLALRPRR